VVLGRNCLEGLQTIFLNLRESHTCMGEGMWVLRKHTRWSRERMLRSGHSIDDHCMQGHNVWGRRKG